MEWINVSLGIDQVMAWKALPFRIDGDEWPMVSAISRAPFLGVDFIGVSGSDNPRVFAGSRFYNLDREVVSRPHRLYPKPVP